MAPSLGFYGDGVSFWVVSDSGSFPGGVYIAQPRWIPGRRILGFDLSQIFPVGGSLLVLCSLPGPPVVR